MTQFQFQTNFVLAYSSGSILSEEILAAVSFTIENCLTDSDEIQLSSFMYTFNGRYEPLRAKWHDTEWGQVFDVAIGIKGS